MITLLVIATNQIELTFICVRVNAQATLMAFELAEAIKLYRS